MAVVDLATGSLVPVVERSRQSLEEVAVEEGCTATESPEEVEALVSRAEEELVPQEVVGVVEVSTYSSLVVVEPAETE